MATIVLVLIMIIPGQDPIIYQNDQIETLGACFAVAQAFVQRGIDTPHDTPVQYQAGCSAITAPAVDAKAKD